VTCLINCNNKKKPIHFHKTARLYTEGIEYPYPPSAWIPMGIDRVWIRGYAQEKVMFSHLSLEMRLWPVLLKLDWMEFW